MTKSHPEFERGFTAGFESQQKKIAELRNLNRELKTQLDQAVRDTWTEAKEVASKAYVIAGPSSSGGYGHRAAFNNGVSAVIDDLNSAALEAKEGKVDERDRS